MAPAWPGFQRLASAGLRPQAQAGTSLLVILLTLRHTGLGNLNQGRLYPLGISSTSDGAQAHMVCLLFLYFV